MTIRVTRNFVHILLKNLDEFGGKKTDILDTKFRRLKEILSLRSFRVQILKTIHFRK